MVYKLVELNKEPKIKFSEEIAKIPVPGKKNIYRVYTESHDYPVLDVLALADEKIEAGQTIKLRSFLTNEKVLVKIHKTESVLNLIWDGKPTQKFPSISESRTYSEKQVEGFNKSVMDPQKPTKYPVYLTEKLFDLTSCLIDKFTIWKEIK